MILRIKKGIIYAIEEGQDERPIGSMFENSTELDERTVECGSEIIPVVEDFIDKVNTGSFKPRSAIKEFEQILKKYAV